MSEHGGREMSEEKNAKRVSDMRRLCMDDRGPSRRYADKGTEQPHRSLIQSFQSKSTIGLMTLPPFMA